MGRVDTIVAAATPPGRGGVGIVRVSGPKVPEIAAVILGELPPARRATFSRFIDAQQETIDVGLAIFFPAPHSYTGEHVLELQGHGGPMVMQMLLRRCLELGARLAEPGEFTRRAYLNDKLLGQVQDSLYAKGLAGIGSNWTSVQFSALRVR